MKEGEKFKAIFTLKVKKAENPQRICNDCALRVGFLHCFSRSLCPDDGTGLNLYFEGAEKIDEENKNARIAELEAQL